MVPNSLNGLKWFQIVFFWSLTIEMVLIGLKLSQIINNVLNSQIGGTNQTIAQIQHPKDIYRYTKFNKKEHQVRRTSGWT